MSLERRISLVTLGVSDVARSTEFYARLGWSKSSASNDKVTFIQLKGIALGLFSRASLAEDAHVEDTPPGFSGVTLAYNVSSEIGVDAVVKFAPRRRLFRFPRATRLRRFQTSGFSFQVSAFIPSSDDPPHPHLPRLSPAHRGRLRLPLHLHPRRHPPALP